jgi:hypothetical protein
LTEDEFRAYYEGLAVEWAQGQFEAIEATQAAVSEFDDSDDGARYLAITGMTMWANIGGDSLRA